MENVFVVNTTTKNEQLAAVKILQNQIDQRKQDWDQLTVKKTWLSDLIKALTDKLKLRETSEVGTLDDMNNIK